MSHRNYDPKPKYFNLGFEPIVGENCSLVNTLFDCADQITIGNNVAMGHDVKILTAWHTKELYGTDRMESTNSAPVIIGDGVWIATGAIIFPGVIIGDNAVIGAGSIVTDSIPSHWFVHGNPARLDHCLLCGDFICICRYENIH